MRNLIALLLISFAMPALGEEDIPPKLLLEQHARSTGVEVEKIEYGRIDLDADGTDEWYLYNSIVNCGTGGCFVYLYKKTEQDFCYVGSSALHFIKDKTVRNLKCRDRPYVIEQQHVLGRVSVQAVKLVDEACVPGKCRCSGDLPPEISESKEGRLATQRLRSGEECIVADFDGNEVLDYAVPTAEGHATIFMSHPSGSVTVIEIDAGGVMELYRPRDSAGENGEPPSAHHGILVRWVGQHHAVFVWESNRFKRHLYPASQNN